MINRQISFNFLHVLPVTCDPLFSTGYRRETEKKRDKNTSITEENPCPANNKTRNYYKDKKYSLGSWFLLFRDKE